MATPKITFIGAGSSVFMNNIVGDVLQRKALAGARIALMDINLERLEESAAIAGKLVQTLGVPATVETFGDQRRALEGASRSARRPAAFPPRAVSSRIIRALSAGSRDTCTSVMRR